MFCSGKARGAPGRRGGHRRRLVALGDSVAGGAVVAVPVVAPGIVGLLLELLAGHYPLNLFIRDLRGRERGLVCSVLSLKWVNPFTSPCLRPKN
ncbi:hypothetical protein FKM82_030577 [Ascaphus truei]